MRELVQGEFPGHRPAGGLLAHHEDVALVVVVAGEGPLVRVGPDLDLDRPREVVLRLEEVPGREERVGRAATLYTKVHVYRRHGGGAFEAYPPGDARRPQAPV